MSARAGTMRLTTSATARVLEGRPGPDWISEMKSLRFVSSMMSKPSSEKTRLWLAGLRSGSAKACQMEAAAWRIWHSTCARGFAGQSGWCRRSRSRRSHNADMGCRDRSSESGPWPPACCAAFVKCWPLPPSGASNFVRDTRSVPSWNSTSGCGAVRATHQYMRRSNLCPSSSSKSPTYRCAIFSSCSPRNVIFVSFPFVKSVLASLTTSTLLPPSTVGRFSTHAGCSRRGVCSSEKTTRRNRAASCQRAYVSGSSE
mmetsp:Transcript_15702/g.47492  ORF Transcript_15702/g.47492 Transcript_15702/m.47492 type:complete len:257 (-) Transcript_15702:622-1392(-)